MKSLYFFLFCFLVNLSFAQTTLSGEMSYLQASISSINMSDAAIVVDNNPGFVEGDKILLIQMKGAEIDLTNTAAFGHVDNFNGAGAHEVAQICSIDGTTLTLDYYLKNNYDPSGQIQVIKIPYYDEVTVTSTLSAPAWNGTSGGVLVLEAETVNLNADVDMSGTGFRGGQYINSTLNCNFIALKTAYFYNNPDDAGKKGEGIADVTTAYQYGKGPLANGGGGGNDHNAGGGGGSNGVAGGAAGINGETGTFKCKGQHPGLGGLSLNYVDNAFLGGGGGAGQGNNNVGTSGANGGGIIFLITNTLNANGYTLRSNGMTAANTTGGDGAGGGGAGGTIILSTAVVNGPLNVEANGGNGGDVDDDAFDHCFGPGGGGSGGVAKISGNLPPSLSYSFMPGQPGVNSDLASSCLNSTSEATSGANGLIIENQALQTSDINYLLCDLPLPIELVHFKAKAIDRTVLVSWMTLSEENNDYFTIERSRDGQNFSEVDRIDGAGSSIDPINYTFEHKTPWSGRSYYRLAQTDFDGQQSFSKTELVIIDKDFDIYSIYPNPIKANQQASISLEILANKELNGQIRLSDILGAEHLSRQQTIEEGFNIVKVDVSALSAGTYILRFETGTTAVTRRVVVF